ncbi:sensor domain-containing diguanylate cyclase [Plesiomonas shigelloides]|uniref:sensor domain-containing diguanylate cyclase n=1 Tax=Plesiomonas shigelloides TaxID=703 RepID=UPI002247D4AA|nr:diguanylate cyclase [Plesiomonas shigelloides]MCX2497310.1 diguanylate cyclase [Plesiomonas shigelloides]
MTTTEVHGQSQRWKPSTTAAMAGQYSLTRQIEHRLIVMLVGVSVSLLLMIAVVLFILGQQGDRLQALLEQEKAAMQQERVRESLAMTSRDYASWSEMYQFVTAPTRQFAEDNMSAAWLAERNSNFAIVLDSTGQLLFSSMAVSRENIDLKTIFPVQDPELLEVIRKLPIFDYVTIEAGKPLTFYRSLNGIPLLLAAAAITTSDEQSLPNGLVILGIYLDDTYMDDQSKQAGVSLRLLFDDAPLTSHREFDGRFWRTKLYTSLQQGEYPLWLEVSHRFDWLERYLLLLVLGLGLIVVMLLGGIALRRQLCLHVTDQIEAFAALARQEGLPQYWPTRQTPDEANELDQLATAYNGLLARMQAAQLELRQQARTDALTGLNNRRALELELETFGIATELPGSVLLLDLDNFKLINDNFGHSAGDQLLVQVAQRMRESLRDTDLLYRLGGDEFAVLLPKTSEAQAQALAERLLVILQQPIEFNGVTLNISASIGVAQSGLQQPIDLMRQADLAMYAAKHGGKGRIRHYLLSMGKKLEIEQAQ